MDIFIQEKILTIYKSMEPREFFIEDHLEENRFVADCNLGESGIRNFSMGELFDSLDISWESFRNISLADSPNRGNISLRKEIARLYGGRITEENVLVTTGTSEALYLFFHILLDKASSVSLFLPAFQALYEIPKMLGAQIGGVDISSEDLSLDHLLSHKADLFIINHPHNPTGKGLKETDWNILEKFLQNSSAKFLFDEHYRFLDYNHDITRSGVHLGKNCFATGSITKCFGVVGLKIGWLVGEKKILDRARSFKDYLTHSVNPVSEYLCEMVLKNRKRLIAPIKKRVIENINFFRENFSLFKNLKEFPYPEGGLVSFIPLKNNISSEEYTRKLMEDCSVFLLPGSSFEKEGFIRIGWGEERERFREGISRWIEWDRKFS